MTFCPTGKPPCYRSKEEEVVIAGDDKIRLKIVGTRVDATGIVRMLCLKCRKNDDSFYFHSLPLVL